MSKRNLCIACGFENSAQAKFCGRCGQILKPLSEETVQPNKFICPNCQYVNQEGVSFCRSCGQAITARSKPEGDDHNDPARFWPLLMVGVIILLVPIGFHLASTLEILAPNPIVFPISEETTTSTPTTTKEVSTAIPSPTIDPSKTPLPTHTTLPSPTSTPLPFATSTATATRSPTPTPIETAVLLPRSDNGNSLSEEGVLRLTFRPELDYTPSLSPDQRTMIFSTQTNNFWLIAEIDPNSNDNGLFRYITTGNVNYENPSFSPDGSSILVSADLDGDMDLYLLDPESGEVIQQLTDFPGKEITPAWMPDGRSILFTGYQDGEEEVYLFRLDNEQSIPLTNNDVFDGFPKASPDGSQITFYSKRDGDYEIYLANIDGSNPRRLTNSPGRDGGPVFSPDGSWIVFESARSGNYEIYAIRPNGEDLQNLTNNPGGDWNPSFSPDGQWLFFQSDRDGDMNIYRQPWLFRNEAKNS